MLSFNEDNLYSTFEIIQDYSTLANQGAGRTIEKPLKNLSMEPTRLKSKSEYLLQGVPKKVAEFQIEITPEIFGREDQFTCF